MRGGKGERPFIVGQCLDQPTAKGARKVDRVAQTRRRRHGNPRSHPLDRKVAEPLTDLLQPTRDIPGAESQKIFQRGEPDRLQTECTVEGVTRRQGQPGRQGLIADRSGQRQIDHEVAGRRRRHQIRHRPLAEPSRGDRLTASNGGRETGIQFRRTGRRHAQQPDPGAEVDRG